MLPMRPSRLVLPATSRSMANTLTGVLLTANMRWVPSTSAAKHQDSALRDPSLAGSHGSGETPARCQIRTVSGSSGQHAECLSAVAGRRLIGSEWARGQRPNVISTTFRRVEPCQTDGPLAAAPTLSVEWRRAERRSDDGTRGACPTQPARRKARDTTCRREFAACLGQAKAPKSASVPAWQHPTCPPSPPPATALTSHHLAHVTPALTRHRAALRNPSPAPRCFTSAEPATDPHGPVGINDAHPGRMHGAAYNSSVIAQPADPRRARSQSSPPSALAVQSR